MADDENQPLDLEKARLDPASVFASPAALVADDRLDREQKLDILRRWEYGASELSVAEEEGMGGGEPSNLAEISKALAELSGEFDVEHTPPTKQGGGV
ncbi:MAG TPA: hypothetical protein VMT85_00015 [Thermoanaerobaculia bacterium]|nr:hypothetical protein [Thermoanaerobaculia bacterium]